ncbi:YtxH domain-containing protein [Clostridium sp. 19966]|uniref:YtxH domain-containing protein n=1 Tax=Clostridium sp. 19966 TaxID=2768166 RepID=UPI0028DE287C|nr:YtxH domain-containing protein [Clostridium sp. 19966]MDT8719100.1 YtxH domain-containing protein [Clostridium sp. 19966]
MKGFISGITTGAIIGAAVGVMMVPELDRSTRKKIKRFDRMLMNVAGDMYNPIKKAMF